MLKSVESVKDREERAKLVLSDLIARVPALRVEEVISRTLSFPIWARWI